MAWAWRHSDGLAKCSVAEKLQPHLHEKQWRVCGQAPYAQGQSLVVDESIEGHGNGRYTLGYALSSSAETSETLPHSFFRRL
jgi:hypothetical protein